RANEVIDVDGLRIDPGRRVVELAGSPVQLTYVEFELLRTLASHPGRVYTREMLLDALWGDHAYREPRTIDVHIRHLREKLEQDPREPRYRSEEHTSELQSRGHLVCRLLLEKKKRTRSTSTNATPRHTQRSRRPVHL